MFILNALSFIPVKGKGCRMCSIGFVNQVVGKQEPLKTTRRPLLILLNIPISSIRFILSRSFPSWKWSVTRERSRLLLNVLQSWWRSLVLIQAPRSFWHFEPLNSRHAKRRNFISHHENQEINVKISPIMQHSTQHCLGWWISNVADVPPQNTESLLSRIQVCSQRLGKKWHITGIEYQMEPLQNRV